ncbi:MAG: cytochrome P450, partial [Chloroflexi bacterium]|nr:cytochrome P450 [Chloroflexota bacterium]
NRMLDREQAVINEIIFGLISQRRAAIEAGELVPEDLLTLLLEAQTDDGYRMDNQQIRDECVTLFMAGHETTANALSWTMLLLAQHPEIAERLRSELDELLGDRPPTLDDLGRLTYTTMVLKESMRLYPPAWITSRELFESVEIGGERIRKASSMVIIAPFTMHRHPEIFPDPERFDPERFHPDRENDIPRYAYIPFGGGPRVCIGNHFAMMEAKLILAAVVQHSDLWLHPNAVIEPEPLITLRPKHGILMTRSRRVQQLERISAT